MSGIVCAHQTGQPLSSPSYLRLPPPTHMLYSLAETVFTCSECRMMIDDNSQVEKEKAMRFCSWHNAKPGISKCRGPVIISNSTFPPRYAERYSALAEKVALSASAPSLFLSYYRSISATCWAQKNVSQMQGCIICQVYHVLF